MNEKTMDKLIREFPGNITEAIKIAGEARLREPQSEIRNVVVCGMGGSGIGGKIVSQWVYNDLEVPFTLVNDYVLPAFVNENTLLIASSYSGNTEETLSAVEDGLSKGAHIVAVCSGGKLQAMAEEKSFDVIVVPGGNPPRASLAFSLVQLVSILEKLELVTIRYSAQLEKSVELLLANESKIKEEAIEIADFLFEKMPIIYSTSLFEGVAIRTRQQLNENAKTLCWHHVIPEMNHNELVGWSGGDKRFAALFLINSDIYERNAFRLSVSKKVMEEKGAGTMVVYSKGESRVEEAIYFIHLVDWVSFYLSEKNKVDPIAIPVIDYLKGELERL